MKLNGIYALSALSAVSFLSWADAPQMPCPSDKLTTSDLQAIDRGELIQKLEEVAGQPWPKIYLYQLVHATPEESAAMFADYEHQKDYLYDYDVRNVKVGKRTGPSSHEVSFTINMPVGSDEQSVVEHTARVEGTRYQIDWRCARRADLSCDSKYSKEISGSACFLPRGTETLMSYTNAVTPDSGLASLGFIKNAAIKKVVNTTRAMGVEFTRIHDRDPARLQRNVEALRKELAATK